MSISRGPSRYRVTIRIAIRIGTGAALALATFLLAMTPASGREQLRASDGGVSLDDGSLLGHEWRTYVFERGRRPCFGIETESGGIRSSFYECLRPRRGLIPILLGQSGDGPGEGTVALVVTPLKVHRVHLNFGRHPDEHVWPKRVSHRKAHQAGVKPRFRYKTLADPGDFCLRRHVEYRRDGSIYYRSYRYPPCRNQAHPSARVNPTVPTRVRHLDGAWLPTTPAPPSVKVGRQRAGSGSSWGR
jgi:hypothetical protein